MSEYLDYLGDVEDAKDKINDLAFKMYQQGRADGAREFAEWLSNTEYVANHDSFILPLRGYFTVDEVVAEWKKEVEE